MQIIDTQKKLETNIQLILSEKVIGVDTEFVRKKTYWPKLSLVQLVSESLELIIDIQAGLDLTTLWEVFRNQDILKVFHSCKQDIEAIYHLSDVIPISIYDTQIGAMFCGYNEPISYAKIVEDFLDIKLDKDLQYSEWGRRPLKKEMYEYAINDARYLIRLYKLLKKRIGKNQKQTWLDQEFSEFSFINEFKDRKKINKRALSNRANYLNIDNNTIDLKKFREDVAILKNLPRKFVLSDKEIYNINKEKPNDINNLNDFIDARS
ncbi:MAG: ribonuclease D [Hyphomicrobiales bacterium]